MTPVQPVSVPLVAAEPAMPAMTSEENATAAVPNDDYDGDEQWGYVHIEVQGDHDSNFAERLFTYNYRLYDKYRRPIARCVCNAMGHGRR